VRRLMRGRFNCFTDVSANGDHELMILRPKL
jgi:hypothetical protein